MRIISWIICIFILIASCRSDKKEAREQDVYYTCSMHPQVVSDKPGKCPICHMDLIAVSNTGTEAEDEIMLSDLQIQLGNISADTVGQGMIGRDLLLTAVLNTDQERTHAVSARIMGRIDRLYFKNTGDYIPKGAALYDLYSEELNNAKEEYVVALEKRRALGNSIIDYPALVESARNKLLLWGLAEGQVRQLERTGKSTVHSIFHSPVSGYITNINVPEGSYVMEGSTILQLADLSYLWAEAQVHTSQLWELEEDAEVEVPGMADKRIKGRIQFVNPETSPGSRFTLLRIRVPNTRNQLRPGMQVNVVIKGRKTQEITLPTDAVIRDSKGATVWIQTGQNTFRSRMVVLGMESGGRVAITSGLDTNDVVVTSGAYLVNSEYIFKRGSNPMEGHQH